MEASPDRAGPASPFVAVFGWVCIVLGGFSPLRVGLTLGNSRSNLYVPNVPIYCAYDLSLSLLTVATGWGLLKRKRWAPLLSSVAAGATVAIGAGSLLVLRLKYFAWAAPGRGDHDRLRFCADHWAFILLNATLVVAWIYALGRLLQRSTRKEFPSPVFGAAGMLNLFLLSFGGSFGLNWWVWASFFAAPPFRF